MSIPTSRPNLMAVLILAISISGPATFGEPPESSPSPEIVQLTIFEMSSTTVWPEGVSPWEELRAGLSWVRQAAAAAPLAMLSEGDIASYSLCPLHLEFVLNESGSKRLFEALEETGIDPVRNHYWVPWLLGKGFLLTIAGDGILGGEGTFRGTPLIYRLPVMVARFDPPTLALQIQPWGNYALLESPDLTEIDNEWKLDRAAIRRHLDGAEVPTEPCGETW